MKKNHSRCAGYGVALIKQDHDGGEDTSIEDRIELDWINQGHIRQYYKTEEKKRFFSKSDGKLDENPDDDEDDSWLDEPNLETFRSEHSLKVSPTIDLSSQCLAAALSDEPSSDTSVAAPNPPEALGES
ncbi:hypothetical protein B0F90DRAFT_1918704 [Multifurca ochricompacta]|uniref:Uncharacterized protein n=1 Tax=Multifurca ochricompacta TaxID=376703 RepID=A0AAD4M127_9AGAM|nr:hypothetical protein B0F90DRAFT_1918704 [Multifurca ochricompacta]